MTLHVLPVLYALFVWWFSTGAILYLDGLPQRTFRWSLGGATLLMAGAVYGIAATSAQTSVFGAYAGFSFGLAIWGWLETGYYMGFMVGPRRQAASAGATGWRRFVEALDATLYHECAALALTAVIAAMTWDMPNKVALWTFLILWGMQVSAKLNVFLGVPNLAEGFLPEHLAFLRSYMTRRPMNLLFPVSITLSLVLATLLVMQAAADGRTAFEAVGLTILSTLMGVAIVEHWFLVVPVPAEALWNWSLRARGLPAQATPAAPAETPDSPAEVRLSRRPANAVLADSGMARTATPLVSRRPT